MEVTTFLKRLAVVCGLITMVSGAYSRGRGAGRGGPQRSPKDAALYDIIGYWTSVVTEDWRFRMVTPPKGDYTLSSTPRRI